MPGVTVDPAVAEGRPMVTGTTVLVETVLRRLTSGMSTGEVARSYGIALDQVQTVMRTCRNCPVKCEILERLS